MGEILRRDVLRRLGGLASAALPGVLACKSGARLVTSTGTAAPVRELPITTGLSAATAPADGRATVMPDRLATTEPPTAARPDLPAIAPAPTPAHSFARGCAPQRLRVIHITEECINCGACEPECPTEAITEGMDTYQIDPDKCVACVGFHPYEACQAVCPVECCIPDPSGPPRTEAFFYARVKALMPDAALPGFSEMSAVHSLFRQNCATK